MSESLATVIPSATQLLFRGEGWGLRPASSEDRAALNGLLSSVPFGGPLAIREDRGGVPARLRVFEAQGTAHDPLSFLIEDDVGAAIGCLSFVVRKARLGADTLTVGHISDLRLSPKHRGASLLPAVLRACCDHLRDTEGVEIFYTGCFDHDQQALGAFTHRDDRRFQQPMAQVMHQLTVGLLPRGARLPGAPSRRIEYGSNATLEEVGEFLHRSHAMSTLGRSESPAGFAARLQQMTGGNLEQIVLVREARGGALACCGAVLPTGGLRQFHFGPLRDAPKRAALKFNLSSWFGGYPRLPLETTSPTPLLQVAFLAQRDEEPGPLRDFLLAIMAEQWEEAARWISVAVPRHSPMARALDDLPGFQSPLSLLAVTRAGTRWNNVDFRAQRCGIEHVFL
ncbi:MAG: GNAT family N-acetyltransferase [Myxococcota bacterium]